MAAVSMQRPLCTLLLAGLAALGGCAAPQEAAQTELTVFAAASLTETLTEIAEDYAAVAPEVRVTFNFDSSGTLMTQIEQGAVCDLFLSAGQQQMDALQAAGCIDAATRTDLLENRVVLAVPAGNPAQLSGFDDLAARLRAGGVLLAVGNRDVPVGQYTAGIFDHYGLDEDTLAASGCLTYGSNVKEVVLQVREGSVDAGIIYATDATSAALPVVEQASADLCGRVSYPAAVPADAPHPDEAAAFLDYLQSDAAMAVFTAVGFAPAN